MNAYSALADYYEIFSDKDCDYESWSQYLYRLLKSHGCVKGADVACGTGKMTRLLASYGFNVLGIDKSKEMLTQATAKGHAMYVCQDMTELALPRKVDFIACVNDGVNYLSDKQTEVFFQRVYDNLKEGGVFAFDISTPYKLREKVGNNVFYIDNDDVTCLWCNNVTGNKVTMDLTFFKRCGELYSRSDEQHIQYIHDVMGLVDKLTKQGFKCTVSDAYSDNELSNDSLRATIVAIKQEV